MEGPVIKPTAAEVRPSASEAQGTPKRLAPSLQLAMASKRFYQGILAGSLQVAGFNRPCLEGGKLHEDVSRFTTFCFSLSCSLKEAAAAKAYSENAKAITKAKGQVATAWMTRLATSSAPGFRFRSYLKGISSSRDSNSRCRQASNGLPSKHLSQNAADIAWRFPGALKATDSHPLLCPGRSQHWPRGGSSASPYHPDQDSDNRSPFLTFKLRLEAPGKAESPHPEPLHQPGH